MRNKTPNCVYRRTRQTQSWRVDQREPGVRYPRRIPTRTEHSFFARARRRCGPSPRSSRREYHHHALSSSSSRRRVTAASPHDASRATTRTAGDAPSQPRRHTRSSHHPSSQRAPRPRPRSMTSRPRRFPFKAAASRLAMSPSSRPPPPRASPSSPESPTQSPDQFRPMGMRVGKPRPFQTRPRTSEPRAHPTTHAAATTSSHRRHSSHWSQRSRDRRTGTTSTLTQITNYPNTNANHNYRNANHPNLPPPIHAGTKWTQAASGSSNRNKESASD